MNLIVDLQYFPSIILYENINRFSNIVFEQYEYYQKMSFRNRCQITGAGGMINLSIPLEKGRDQKTLLKDVRISDRDDWQGQHWKTILSCYSRSPWLEFYQDELEGLYRRRLTFLLDWNLSCFEWSVGVLKMPVSFSLTQEYQKEYGEEDWADWRGKILPKNRALLGSVTQGSQDYTAGSVTLPGQLSTPEPDSDTPVPGFGNPISSSGIRVPSSGNSFRDPAVGATPIKYRQVFEERIGFLPNLSILDLLFCEGKNARTLLLK